MINFLNKYLTDFDIAMLLAIISTPLMSVTNFMLIIALFLIYDDLDEFII